MAALTQFLNRQQIVRAAYLVVIEYPRESNLAPAGYRALTVLADLNPKASRNAFDLLSQQSESMLEDKLGDWRHLDWLVAGPALIRLGQRVGLTLRKPGLLSRWLR
jgi:hypothetical protein